MIENTISVTLPGELKLDCPSCRGSFSLPAVHASRRQFIACPLCLKNFNVYDGLSGDVRRRLYHAVRDYIEQRVYETKAMESRDYFEDQANLPPAEE